MLVHTLVKLTQPNVRLVTVGLGVCLESRNVVLVQSVYQDTKYELIVQLLMIDSARSAPQERTKLVITLMRVLPVQLERHGAQWEL